MLGYSLDELPAEMILTIIKLQKTEDFLSLVQTCKKLYNYLESETVSSMMRMDFIVLQSDNIGHMLRTLDNSCSILIAKKLDITPIFQTAWHMLAGKHLEQLLIPFVERYAHSSPATIALLHWMLDQYEPSSPKHFDGTLFPAKKLLWHLSPMSHSSIEKEPVDLERSPNEVCTVKFKNNFVMLGEKERPSNGLLITENEILVEIWPLPMELVRWKWLWFQHQYGRSTVKCYSIRR
jgi:hypothetical protein